MKLEVSRSIKDEGELAQVRPLTRKVNRWIYMSEKKLLFVYFTVIIKDESSYRVTEGRQSEHSGSIKSCSIKEGYEAYRSAKELAFHRECRRELAA